MNTIKSIFTVGLLLASVNVYAADNIETSKFVETAAAAGVKEIEVSQMAVIKASSGAVKAFAQQMIVDHTKVNAELSKIAKAKNLNVATDSAVHNKPQAVDLKSLEGESFDKAYVSHQIMAHKEAIALFERGVNAEDAEISAYAKSTLPKLEHHLKMAEDLADKTTVSKKDNKDLHRLNDSSADANKPM